MQIGIDSFVAATVDAAGRAFWVSANSGKGNPQKKDPPAQEQPISEPGKSESCQFLEKRASQEAAGKAISKV